MYACYYVLLLKEKPVLYIEYVFVILDTKPFSWESSVTFQYPVSFNENLNCWFSVAPLPVCSALLGWGCDCFLNLDDLHHKFSDDSHTVRQQLRITLGL